MRLRVALKLLDRLPPRSFAWRRRRDALGAIWMAIPIRGDLQRAERRVVRARCRRGVHRIRPIDKLQTFAACTWCWDPKTKVWLS